MEGDILSLNPEKMQIESNWLHDASTAVRYIYLIDEKRKRATWMLLIPIIATYLVSGSQNTVPLCSFKVRPTVLPLTTLQCMAWVFTYCSMTDY